MKDAYYRTYLEMDERTCAAMRLRKYTAIHKPALFPASPTS
jgi:hypothetical protein